MQDDLISLFLINYFQFINMLHTILKECEYISQKKIVKKNIFNDFLLFLFYSESIKK